MGAREGQAELGDLGPSSLHCNVNSCLFLDVSKYPLGCDLNFLHKPHSAKLKLTVKGISLEI